MKKNLLPMIMVNVFVMLCTDLDWDLGNVSGVTECVADLDQLSVLIISESILNTFKSSTISEAAGAIV